MSDRENNSTDLAGLTPDEAAMLKESMLRRKDIVDIKFKGGAPEDNRDIRVVNELMNSLDDAILRVAKLRQDDQKNKDDIGIQSSLLAVLKESKSRHAGNRKLVVDDSVYDGEIEEGLLKESGSELDTIDFLDGDE